MICQISATKTNKAVVVVDGEFSWNIDDEEVRKGGIVKEGSREDHVVTLKNINLEVKQGELVAIVGPVGSGKSSLLLALLGEMEVTIFFFFFFFHYYLRIDEEQN
jgi:ABC-type multidrug transport system fused ATPase/permease subunit